VAICARTESAKRCGEAGWLHRLREDRVGRTVQGTVRSVALSRTVLRQDLVDLAAGYQQAASLDQLRTLANVLGLSTASLLSLGTGWAAGYRSWSFPMMDAARRVLGIRLRRPDGYKFAVKGSKEGLFLPEVEAADEQLLIAEGATDTAALLHMGFKNVAGRPCCMGGIKLVVELVTRRHPTQVVVVSDADEVGRRGAADLAAALLAHAPTVRVIQPPDGVEDVRAFLQAGGTWQDVQRAILAAPVRQLAVRAREVMRRAR
jgi:hypothetical protein